MVSTDGNIKRKVSPKTKSSKKADDFFNFKLKMREVIQNNRQEIIEEFYQKWLLLMMDTSGHKNIEWLAKVCTSIKIRFMNVLDRFINILNGNDNNHDFGDEQDLLEYSLRFIIPAIHKKLDTHVVVRIVKCFIDTVSATILKNIKPSEYSLTKADVINMLNELVYICFENLWVTSVIGFRHQQSVIRGLLSKLMKAQEEERQKFWTEIHDDFLQTLAVIPIKLQAVEELAKVDTRAMKAELNQLRQIIEETTQTIRGISHGFNLFWIERKGLAFSLRAFTRRFEREFAIPVKLSISKKRENIGGFPGVTLFRIIQEALFNVGRHSKATWVRVKIDQHNAKINIEIEDNGIGFDVRQSMRRRFELKHLGLLFMKERIELLNGSMKIESLKDAGTKLTINVPARIFMVKK